MTEKLLTGMLNLKTNEKWVSLSLASDEQQGCSILTFINKDFDQNVISAGPAVIKLLSSSAQLSMKFQLLMNV